VARSTGFLSANEQRDQAADAGIDLHVAPAPVPAAYVDAIEEPTRSWRGDTVLERVEPALWSPDRAGRFRLHDRGEAARGVV
jgi:hypothetical protein